MQPHLAAHRVSGRVSGHGGLQHLFHFGGSEWHLRCAARRSAVGDFLSFVNTLVLLEIFVAAFGIMALVHVCWFHFFMALHCDQLAILCFLHLLGIVALRRVFAPVFDDDLRMAPQSVAAQL